MTKMAKGFKCGIEIHQRLDTKKLFCDCYYNDEKGAGKGHESTVTRRLRAVTGELGIVDPAAEFEEAKGKPTKYLYNDANACLVELDEEPPHQINPDALAVALAIAEALNAKPVDEIHVMRKTVVDGSAVGGFQRTALVALDGVLKTSKGNVAIPTICLEEESAGILDNEGSVNAYRLDRLGVPLIELATDASLKDGEHAAETARLIGDLLRATNRVQRGIGSIRQDVNVSIQGGNRVEVKGAQDLQMLPELIANEVLRQESLLNLKEKTVKLNPNGHVKSVHAAFKHTRAQMIANALSSGKTVMATKLDGYAGVLGKELMPNHRYGTELSDYAKTAAGVRGIIHSDEDLSKYGITPKEDATVRAELSCNDTDAWVACVAEETVAVKALEAVIARAREKGVPKETRKANGDTSKFMRPLPGAARMYPETDVKPIVLTKELLKQAKTTRLEPLEKKSARYEKLGLPKAMAEEMARDRNNPFFEDLATPNNALLLASTILQTLKAIRREGEDVSQITEKDIAFTIRAYDDGEITKQAVAEILRQRAKGKPAAKTATELTRIRGKELEELLAKAGDLAQLMRENRLRVDGEEAARLFASHKRK